MLRTRRTGINLDEYMRSQILEEQVTQLVTNGSQTEVNLVFPTKKVARKSKCFSFLPADQAKSVPAEACPFAK